MSLNVDEKTRQRFWSDVDTSGGTLACWIWLGRRKNGDGIPLFNITKSRTINPAKFTFELKYGAIPKGRQIKKTCQSLLCCNPDHVIRHDDHASNFWSMVAIADEHSCWNWLGECSLGRMPEWDSKDSGLSRRASRAAFELTKGAIPEDKRVRHTCNNLRCCNPSHLVLSSEVEERFLSKIDKTPGFGPEGTCWRWTDHIKASGYGEFRPDSKSRVQAHRFSYELFKGSIPDGLVIMHVCDTRSCTNPSHLIAGTQKDNIQDMIRKGRDNFIPPLPVRGEQSPSAKLTETKVSKIKEFIQLGMSDCEIARRYSVGRETIRCIRKGLTWKHIK